MPTITKGTLRIPQKTTAVAVKALKSEPFKPLLDYRFAGASAKATKGTLNIDIDACEHTRINFSKSGWGLLRDSQTFDSSSASIHRTTVSGLTMIKACRQLLQKRESKIQKRRSRLRSWGRLTDCFITAN